MSDAVETVNNNAIDSVTDLTGKEELTLEATLLLVTLDMVSNLEKKTRQELEELRKRQGQVTYLHKLLKAINKVTKDKGDLDLSNHPEIKELLQGAKDLGVEIDLNKVKYTTEERQRLVENIRMTCDDWNTQNDMQLQTVTRLNNERYEAFQMARSIMKPLHDDKVNKARSIAR